MRKELRLCLSKDFFLHQILPLCLIFAFSSLLSLERKQSPGPVGAGVSKSLIKLLFWRTCE